MTYGVSNGHVTDDVTWPPKTPRGSTVGYPSNSLASGFKSPKLILVIRQQKVNRINFPNILRQNLTRATHSFAQKLKPVKIFSLYYRYYATKPAYPTIAHCCHVTGYEINGACPKLFTRWRMTRGGRVKEASSSSGGGKWSVGLAAGQTDRRTDSRWRVIHEGAHTSHAWRHQDNPPILARPDAVYRGLLCDVQLTRCGERSRR